MLSRNLNWMEIRIHYDGEHIGTAYYNSPHGGNNKFLWWIGSKILLFGAWVMFGRKDEWEASATRIR